MAGVGIQATGSPPVASTLSNSSLLSPRSPVIKLRIPELSINRAVRYDTINTGTVAEMISSLLKRNPMPNPEGYGLFLLPNDDASAAMLLSDTELMNSYKITPKDSLELRKITYLQVSLENGKTVKHPFYPSLRVRDLLKAVNSVRTETDGTGTGNGGGGNGGTNGNGNGVEDDWDLQLYFSKRLLWLDEDKELSLCGVQADDVVEFKKRPRLAKLVIPQFGITHTLKYEKSTLVGDLIRSALSLPKLQQQQQQAQEGKIVAVVEPYNEVTSGSRGLSNLGPVTLGDLSEHGFFLCPFGTEEEAAQTERGVWLDEDRPVSLYNVGAGDSLLLKWNPSSMIFRRFQTPNLSSISGSSMPPIPASPSPPAHPSSNRGNSAGDLEYQPQYQFLTMFDPFLQIKRKKRYEFDTTVEQLLSTTRSGGNIEGEEMGLYLPPYDDEHGVWLDSHLSLHTCALTKHDVVQLRRLKDGNQLPEDEVEGGLEDSVNIFVNLPPAKFQQNMATDSAKVKVGVELDTLISETKQQVMKVLHKKSNQLEDFYIGVRSEMEDETVVLEDEDSVLTNITSAQSIFELKRKESAKETYMLGVEIVLSKTRQIRRAQTWNERTTVKDVVDQLFADETLPTHLLHHDDFLLYLPANDDGDGLWLEEVSVTLSSYGVAHKDVLHFKKRTYEENSSEGINIALPQSNHTFTVDRSMLISKALKKALKLELGVLDSKHLEKFGLFTSEGLWLNPCRSFKSYAIDHTLAVELRKKPVEIKVIQTIRFRHEAQDAFVSYFYVEENTTTQQLLQDVIEKMEKRAWNIEDLSNFRFYCPKKRLLLDLDLPLLQQVHNENASTIVLELVVKDLPVELHLEENTTLGIQEANIPARLDFNKPLSECLPLIKSSLNLMSLENILISLIYSCSASTYGLERNVELSMESSLKEHKVVSRALILVRISEITTRQRDSSDPVQVDKNIWEEGPDSKDNIVYDRDGSIIAGTLNKLIMLLTSEKKPDPSFMKTFLLTYQSFTTPSQLLSKLIQRYHVPAPEDVEPDEFNRNVRRPIQLRVCNVLKNWIETCFADLSDELIVRLNEFTDTIMEADGLQSFSTMLKNTTQKMMEVNQQGRQYTFRVPAPEPKLPSSGLSNFNIMDIDEEELARQITLIHFDIFSSIKPTELLNLCWTKPKYQYQCPHVMQIIDHFNMVSLWVPTVILHEETARARARALCKIVNIAKFLRSYGNFHGLMAVMAGICSTAVKRLKLTFKEVSKKHLELIDELEKLMNSSNSYKTYRNALHSQNPPRVPYLGVYLGDLIFIEEANQQTTYAGLINFAKRKLVANVILEIQQYQQLPYNLTPIPKISAQLNNLTTQTENQLVQLSLKREPRANTSMKKTMLQKGKK